jgi:hypothetical protein
MVRPLAASPPADEEAKHTNGLNGLVIGCLEVGAVCAAAAVSEASMELEETDVLRRLNYAAAVACGVFAALAIHIVLSVFGVGLDAEFGKSDAGHTQQFISALAWWAVAAAGFIGGWGTGAYLIAATREREFVSRLARRFLVALVFAVATAGGIMSKSDNAGGTADVTAGLIAVGLGLICAYCGARLAYLNAEQV